MASRLSDLSLKARLDAGQKNLPAHLPEKGQNLLTIDFDKVLASGDPEGFIQSLPPQVVYHGIKERGLEASAGILSCVTTDQLTRFLDYDCWPKDVHSPETAIKWLLPYRALGPTGLAQRYSELEEEYQLAILEKHVQMYSEEEVEKLSESIKDELIPIQGSEIYYRVVGATQEVEDFVIALIQSAIALDVKYALSLLAHAAYVPPNENELLLLQFRKARLEEDGFLTYEESKACFLPVDHKKLKAQWRLASVPSMSGEIYHVPDGDGVTFLEQTIGKAAAENRWSDEDGVRLHQSFLYLANSVSTVCGVEPGDVDGLNLCLEHIRGLVSLGLEYLAGANPSLAVEVLKQEFPKKLFQVGLSLVYDLQARVIDGLHSKNLARMDEFEKLVKLHKWGQAQWFIDAEFSGLLSLQEVELLKGLFNRFPMRAVKQEDLTILYEPVRGLGEFHELTNSFSDMKGDLH